MEENTIKKYAQIMKELELSALEISENGKSIRLERSGAASGMILQQAALQSPSPTVSDPLGLLHITSPMVGMFYTAAAENLPPLVTVGSVVKKGDVLCVIESMKLMNEIVSEYDGVIEEVCVQNKQEVDYGHVLFKLAASR